MSEILNDIINCCGIVFIVLIGFAIICWIILKIKEITYNAHQNLIKLRNIKRKCREARDEIENLTPWDEGLVEMHEVLSVLDKLIEESEVGV